MILNARCEMTVATTVPTAIVMMIEPLSGPAQDILKSSVSIQPETPHVKTIDVFGNACQRTVLPAGTSVITAEITASVPDAIDVHATAVFTPVQDLPDSVLHYLLPSRYCQSDLLLELATKIIGNASPGYEQVEAIRNWIHQNIEYKYGCSGPSTTAVDTSQSRQGVCRDYAHLGIALCRAVRIPARMVSGFLYQLDPMDLHAWFEAFVCGRWYTFDATQPQPRGNRIILSYGRDAAYIAQLSEYGNLEMKGMHVQVDAAP
jgi:transglutaminase-like putative cysteine protease